MEDKSKETVCEEISRRLSHQRHDFLNHMQVVYSYIQIGKADKALRYLDDLVASIKKEAGSPQYQCPEKSTRTNGSA